MFLLLKSSSFDCHSSAIRPFAIRHVIQISKAHLARPGEKAQAGRSPPSLPAYPKFLTGFCFLPPPFPLTSPPLRIPPSSLQSSLFLPALSNVHQTREQVSFANAFGDDGEKGARVLACRFPHLELCSTIFFKPAACRLQLMKLEFELKIWIHGFRY